MSSAIRTHTGITKSVGRFWRAQSSTAPNHTHEILASDLAVCGGRTSPMYRLKPL